MLNVVAIGGPPASGKSTLVKGVLKHLGLSERKKYKLLVFEKYPKSKVIVLGYYQDDDGFGGTDKLSMAVQPEAAKVIEKWSKDPGLDNWSVLFEGDRLINSSFLSALQNMPKVNLQTFFLVAEEDELLRRHESRGDKQGGTWLKGRESKVRKLMESVPCKVLDNGGPKQLSKNVKTILAALTA